MAFLLIDFRFEVVALDALDEVDTTLGAMKITHVFKASCIMIINCV